MVWDSWGEWNLVIDRNDGGYPEVVKVKHAWKRLLKKGAGNGLKIMSGIISTAL